MGPDKNQGNVNDFLHTYGLHSTLEDQKILRLRIDAQLFQLLNDFQYFININIFFLQVNEIKHVP